MTTVEQQLDLFAQAAAARDTAIAAVDANADDAWKALAWDTLVNWLRTHPEFHCDDIWTTGLPAPAEPRALGAVIQRAAREGLMAKSGGYRPSVRSHLSVKPVWASRIYGGPR